jgi:tetratricopeptide (TPR) repeat protein
MEEDELKQAISLLERDKQRANSLLRSFVERYPENWRGFLCLAGSESILQNYENAVHYLHIALYLSPNNPNILRNLAYCYRQLGQLPLGTFYYQKAFELNKWQDPEIAVLLASSLCELGHHQQGCPLFKQAQEKFQHSPLVNFYHFLASNNSVTSPAWLSLTWCEIPSIRCL